MDDCFWLESQTDLSTQRISDRRRRCSGASDHANSDTDSNYNCTRSESSSGDSNAKTYFRRKCSVTWKALKRFTRRRGRYDLGSATASGTSRVIRVCKVTSTSLLWLCPTGVGGRCKCSSPCQCGSHSSSSNFAAAAGEKRCLRQYNVVDNATTAAAAAAASTFEELADGGGSENYNYQLSTESIEAAAAAASAATDIMTDTVNPSSRTFTMKSFKRKRRPPLTNITSEFETCESFLHAGELIWFDPGVGHALPGEVLEYHKPAQVLTVQAVIAGKPQIFSLTSANGLKRRQDLGQNGIDDMIQLNDLNEASLLWNLKIRYEKELIYTYTGSILIAVNPYKMYDMYGLDMVKKYEGQILGVLPPHLFAIGSAAYSGLARSNQAVVISGESGSGKTESTKLVMQYLAAVNKSPSNLITEQILEASPLLESFGNAKTVRNDNSSRFGKYLEVYFKEGIIIGARVTEYLLEKSRIVTQAPDERNYHVFYELLAGLTDEEKLKYGLLSADKYFYLNQGGNCDIAGKYDSEDFQSLLSAMQVLGFTSEEQDTIFRILASVLHLGNVYFHRKQLKHGQEGVEIGSDAEIRWTGHLLKLDADGIKQALTTKTTEARNERLFTSLNIDQALDTRDAFAKALYSSLFTWLVARINHIVYKGTKRTSAISILDIFGFEDFKENSFEQLCINYANENLQFYFNKHIFKLEQQEYAKEKIQWQNITFNDNLPVIHLLSKKPVGILHLLDDESNFPKATDSSFLEKCHYNHALNELYSRPRLNVPEFGIRHFAGPVWYNVDGFLDKNRDTLRTDVVDLLISSSLPMVSKMFSALRNTYETSKTLNKANGRFVTMKPRTPTVAARFHDSLQQLLESMSKCHPWFVRCVKPNNEKAAIKFDMPVVLEQLRYSGMLETIRIRKLGYPVRMRFLEFVERYRYLLPPRMSVPRGSPARELCHIILDKFSDDFQLGTTRVFLRENLERLLERERADVLHMAAIVIQRNVRGFLAQKRYNSIKHSAIKIQSRFRGWKERRKYMIIKNGVVKSQALFRGRRQRRRYNQLKEDLKRRSEKAKERARIKAQKEESDRTPRVSTSLNQLDIPVELAYIFDQLDDTQPVHNERQIVKVVGPVLEKKELFELPHDIDQHGFAKFSSIYFKSGCGVLREPIKAPFLNKTKDSDYADSLAVFKLILRFMNDESLTDRREQALGDYIAYKGIANEKLRDEILCQLVNQTYRNDVPFHNEKGWLLMANCLSVFPPSSALYKLLLKYVSDFGHNGYKAVCQQKLLQSHNLWARTYPPCLLEWKANRKKVNMAVQINFTDGESTVTDVDSWTRCESICESVLADRGIAECHGWTLSVDSNEDQRNGLDYVFDVISEMEFNYGFPIEKQNIVPHSQKAMENHPVTTTGSKRPSVPPPKPPITSQPVSHPKMRSVSRDHAEDSGGFGLSRRSALNDRYFEKETTTRSRSLDNLLSPVVAMKTSNNPVKLEKLGLSNSRLNDRYHSQSMERIQEINVDIDTDMSKSEDDNLESVSQRGENRKYSLTGASSDILGVSNQLDFDFPDLTRSEDDKGSYMKGHPRFIKSQYAGKRAGSHSSRYGGDKLDMAVRSSALSDTSEAPSLASHVRRVRVPSQASDVDQYLDELFNPVLVLDQLSDARSLAASIKGTTDTSIDVDCDSEFQDFLSDPDLVTKSIRGGGRTVAGVGSHQTTAQSPTSGGFNFTPLVNSSSSMLPGIMTPPSLLMPSVPSLYNSPGLLQEQPNSTDPNVLAYQANLQNVFLQSAITENFRIQQQLLAQSQAFQQFLLQQHPSENSPPKLKLSPPAMSSPPLTHLYNNNHKPPSPQSNFTNVLSELKNRRSSVESNNKSGIPPPPPPPMPPPPELGDPSETRPFMDPYGRAKTVRIGKWRWPPPKDGNQPQDVNFMQFKMKQKRKHSHEFGDSESAIEWEEYELTGEQEDIMQSQPHSQPVASKAPLNEVHRSSYKSLEVGSARPSPGSVGKLRISNEMKHKLEMVTAGHSMRSTGKPRPSAIQNLQSSQTGKLDSDRRLLLQHQLAGRWGSVDNVDSRVATKEERNEIQHNSMNRNHHQVENRIDKSNPNSSRRPPPPPIAPVSMSPPSRNNSFYNHNPVIPPPPVQPVSREMYDHNSYNNSVVTNGHSEQPDVDEPSNKHFVHRRESTRSSSMNHSDSNNSTVLFNDPNTAHFMYNRVHWSLNIRKEVFSPKETTSSPLVLHLIFCQIVTDVLTKNMARINSGEKNEILQLFERYDITISNLNSNQHKTSTKRSVIEVAQHWLFYFSRIFPISCGYENPDVQLLAITHSGIRLATIDSNKLKCLQAIRLEDINEVETNKGGASLEILLITGESFPIYSSRSRQIYAMLNAFLRENGSIVKMRVDDRVRSNDVKPWLQDKVQQLTSSPNDRHQLADDGKHSLLQFAMHHFRRSNEKFEVLKTPDGEINGSLKLLHNKKGGDWTWKEQVDLVKYTSIPVTESLLKLDLELNRLAVECFECVMRYMGDLPITPELNEVKCVYTVLMHCHKFEPLRDEVYCQLMKQTTSNKTDSCQRGWRLLSIVAAYFMCSEILRPYLLKYLETAAYDKRRAFHGTANVCLQNLRKTLRYGGRKNVPSVEEVTAVSAGRNSKRQMYRLPGGSETVINTKSTTVVDDIVSEMCTLINVNNPIEIEEFSLYCIVEGDAFTMPLAREEYILDVTTELQRNQQAFYLIFCRSVWYFPLRLDCHLYVQVLFNQIAPDYLEGLLLVMPNEQLPVDCEYELAKLAALLHRAADLTLPPTLKETKFLLPQPALTQRDIKPAQWVQMVQTNWTQTEMLPSIEAKAQFLEILSKWPLFGSSFFAVKRGAEQQILSLNRYGVHFLNLNTHETISSVPYNEIISTRKVRAESGILYLEMKCGNLFQQRVARLQTDQAHEIARLIRQYMSLHRQQMSDH